MKENRIFDTHLITMSISLYKLTQQVALENVRCEELQLELSAALKSKYSTDPTNRHQKPQTGSSGANTATITWAPAHTHSSQHHKVTSYNIFNYDHKISLDISLSLLYFFNILHTLNTLALVHCDRH